jgi:DNA-directed RNA polymerase I, II, and III subunit RPABC5
MIIPVRCFTCNKVLADKWNYFKKELEKNDKEEGEFTIEDISIPENEENPLRYFDDNKQKQILEKLGITKMWCVRHFISHIDLIDII